MVVGAGVHGPFHHALARGNAATSPGFLGCCMDGTINCDRARFFAHGGGHGPLGWPVVLHRHSAISGRPGIHAPLPGLTPDPSDLRL
jgi:hypothetical protein